MRNRLALAVLALLLAFGSVTARAEDKSGVRPNVISLPSGPGSIEGLGPSFEPQLNTGTASYSVSMVAPPGVAGHQPSLSLNYSSGLGNGHFGIGWSLSTARVIRQFDKGIPDYDANDVFEYSNGEELVPLSNGFWRFENEQQFVRFQRVGDGWEAREKNGVIIRLGQFPNVAQPNRRSRVSNPEVAGTGFESSFAWHVDQIEDANGNLIDFYYEEFAGSPGQLYLARVEYARSGDRHHAVVFDYEPRADEFRDYRAGFKQVVGQRGSRVRVFSYRCLSGGCPQELVREYRLEYGDASVQAAINPRSANAVPLAVSNLTRITQYDGGGVEGGNHLPPLQFSYTQLHIRDWDNPPAGNFPSFEDIDLNGNGVLDGLTPESVDGAPVHLNFVGSTDNDWLDVDQDGLADVLTARTSGHVYFRNLGRGRFAGEQPMPMGGAVPSVPLSASGTTLADMDADGRADFVASVAGTGGMVFWRGRGNGSWSPSSSLGSPPAFAIGSQGVRLVDANFDKQPDLVRSADGSNWELCLQSGAADKDYAPFGNFPGVEDVDHNGDGATDAADWSCRAVAVPFTSQGLPQVFFDSPAADLQWSDANGDRIQDLIFLQAPTPSTRIAWVWYHRGDLRFDPPVVMAVQGSSFGHLDLGASLATTTSASLRLLDVTGDGLTDLIFVRPNGGVRLWINLGGDRWSSRVDISGTPSFKPENTALRWVDINGNGSTDLVFLRSTGPVGQRWQFVDFVPGIRPGQLKVINSGLGSKTTISYLSATEERLRAEDDGNPWATTIPLNVDVVSRTTVSLSLDLNGDGENDRYVTDYQYRDGYFEAYEKEFRGFSFAKKISRGEEGAPTLVTRRAFHTGAPDERDNDGDGQVDERSELGGAEEEPLKGVLLWEEVTTEVAGADSREGDGRPAANTESFNRKDSTWVIRQLFDSDGGTQGIETIDARNVSFPYRSEERHEVIERTSEPVTIRSNYEFDDFGNLTREALQGVVGEPGDERVTHRIYASDRERWNVDRLCRETIEDGDGERVAETRRYYDGEAFVGL